MDQATHHKGRFTRGDMLWTMTFLFVGAYVWSIVFKKEPISYKELVRLLPVVCLLRGATKPYSEPSKAGPFRVAPSFTNGIYGGLIGGAMAGLLAGIVYYVQF